MKMSILRQRLKPWMLPIAMLAGMVFHDFMGRIEFIAPYLIFIMLFITFCRVKPHEFRITRLSWGLLSVQILGAIAVYFCLLPLSPDIAQGTFICVFCPTATAAPVITGMLGGSVPRLATFSIISNVTVAILAPILFTLMGTEADITFMDSLTTISMKVMPLIILPLILALLLLKVAPKVHRAVAERQAISFYIWAVSLFIVVGRAVSFIMDEPAAAVPEMILLAIFSGIVCCGQFWIGRKIGHRCGDKIAGAQGLGQKNTVLAIWMALTYLNPVSSVAPAAYVAWQNTINSAQLYFKAKRDAKNASAES
ncbi:bile acid:sodium symporter family protein [uncultured Duncaniella sp.]|uniref:bile acid:sodium symporter family protein n=1 Tax=uncultured Duncaniella sp. TaxID=2768039 RepID=UPI002632C7A3|nr:transporter [uncultured Duncaniella sp.]